MIYKSYIIENNLTILKNNVILFYGENLGLIDDFKRKIEENHKSRILKYTQDEVLKNENILISEIKNISLFDEKRIYFIQDVNDKILNFISKIINEIKDEKIYLFSNLLDKKSKIRNFFEKQKETDIIACYPDNEATIKKLILSNLKDFTGLTTEIINIIIDCCSCERVKLNNEIKKIKSYFLNKNIDKKNLLDLLNLREDDGINLIRDSALAGNNKLTNNLLKSIIIEPEKAVYFISIINNRLVKLNEIKKINSSNIEKVISEMKPPIFWKDKPFFLAQAKLWNKEKLKLAIEKIYQTELITKSQSNINKEIILKKLIVDICNIASAA